MIYCLEDDDSIRELVIYTLNQTGLTAKGFAVPSAFWKAMEEEQPSLLLLDIMLPEEDGLSILKKLRANPHTEKLPVMMLTAKGTEYDKVVGLDSGADDYMTKPFGMMELVSRVRALMRRTQTTVQKESSGIQIGDLCVDESRHRVTVQGQEVLLTLKEYELLTFLLENRGLVFSRDQILDRIWGYHFDGESRTVDVHIRTLRMKLVACSNLIETVRGIGYRFSEKAN